MADRTDILKATIKTLRLKQRASLGKTSSVDSPSHEILTNKAKKTTPFNKLAKNAVDHVTQLRDFILKHRRDYIDATGYLTTDNSSMTDEERDLIDNGVEEFINQCSELINKVKNTLSSTKEFDTTVSCGEQCRQHRQAVVESLQNYLREICKLYTEQKAIRVKRIVDKKRVSRLQPEGVNRTSFATPTNDSSNHGNRHTSLEEPRLEKSQIDTEKLSAGSTSVVPVVSSQIERFEDSLSAEEVATFQQENVLMMEHMNSLVDEVKQIEGKVLAISKLQETFTEKVLQQAEGLNRIHQLTVTSTENMKSGNEEIRSAIRNQGSLRMWILFILIVCSFTLLFLDWYS